MKYRHVRNIYVCIRICILVYIGICIEIYGLYNVNVHKAINMYATGVKQLSYVYLPLKCVYSR